MPVYNVEKYMECAIESVLKQTFRDVQLILVDDASTDNSAKICDKYKKEDVRVEVIHKGQNEGLSYARNSGIPYAKGKYILFMDSDDYINENLLQHAYSELQKNQAQVVIWGVTEEYYKDDGKLEYSKEILFPYLSITNRNDLRQYVIELEEKTLYGYAWNKLYNTSYLKEQGYLYKKLTMIEDLEFNTCYFESIDSMIVLNEAAYHYCNRDNGSLTRKYLPDYFALHVMRIKLILEQQIRWKLCTPEVKSKLGARYCRYFISAIQRYSDSRSRMTISDRKKWIKEQYNSEIYKLLIDDAKSDNKILGFLILLIKNKCTNCLMLIGMLIYFIKHNFGSLFIRLKQNR